MSGQQANLSRDLEAKLHALEQVARDWPDNAPASSGEDVLRSGVVVDGRYSIVHPIASGAQGEVFLAVDRQMDATAVLKVFHLGLAEVSASERGRFLREAQTSLLVGHTNVVTPYDIGVVGCRPYLVMPFVEGDSLDRLQRKRGHFDLLEVDTYLHGLANGIHAVHEAGMVHRDIKPQNILIGADGVPKLVDFGVAMEVAGTRVTEPGTAVGTPAYMAPEVVQGLPVDHRADIYSLGILCYRMMTGVFPYVTKNLLDMLLSHVHLHPVAPSRMVSHVPEEFDDVILKCLSKDPDQRYSYAPQFAEAFRNIVREIASSSTMGAIDVRDFMSSHDWDDG